MLRLKFRYQSVAPRRDDGSILPAALAGVLLVLAVVQLISADAFEMPLELPVGGRGTPYRTPTVNPIVVEPGVLARPLFAPRQSAATATTPTSPLGGAQVAGMVSVRGRVLAVVRRGDGRIVNMAPGQRVDGWQLVGVTGSGAVFVKAGNRLAVPFTAAGAVAPTEAPEEEQQ